MSSLAVTSITDFILAAEALFLAGMQAAMPKARFSAAWYWSGMLLLLGLGALIGGIDHGLVEPSGQPRYFIERADWIVLGATTFCVLMATATQFFPPRAQRIVLGLATIQFAANTIIVLLVDSFLVVALNYAPVMILLLSMNSIKLKSGAGSWQITAGILVLFAATGIQVLGVDYFSPLDHNGLYHVVTMVGVFFLFLSGRKLKTDTTA
jgi:hypothetical protein